MSSQTLEKIANDMDFLKEQIMEMRKEVNEIGMDLHVLRPEYRKKIKKIEKEGKFKTYSSINELKKSIEENV